VNGNDVRVEIYRSFVERGSAPVPHEIAAALGLSVEDVEAALDELARDDVIVLLPGTHLVWLAHPFSAATAPFRVTSGDRSWDAICIWDALGILAVAGVDGDVTTACPDCSSPLEVSVREGEVRAPGDYLVHYGVPAARWYEDVGYT
jgi:hypothetical protein